MKSFVQISTAFVNCEKEGWVEEKIYPITRDPRALLNELQAISVQDIEKRTPRILGRYPNTYTFTQKSHRTDSDD